MQRVGSEHFKLLYDIYHMQIMEGNVIRTIQKNHQYLGHYHTGGVPGRHEIDETQELYYPAIMRAILKRVSRVTWPRSLCPPALTRLRHWRDASAFVMSERAARQILFPRAPLQRGQPGNRRRCMT